MQTNCICKVAYQQYAVFTDYFNWADAPIKTDTN